MADSQVSQYRRENDQRFTSDEDLDACFEPDEPIKPTKNNLCAHGISMDDQCEECDEWACEDEQ